MYEDKKGERQTVSFTDYLKPQITKAHEKRAHGTSNISYKQQGRSKLPFHHHLE